MGKSKKDKKNKNNDEFDDIENVVEGDIEESASQSKPTVGKKGKKNRKKNDDWEDDIANEIAKLNIDENGSTPEPIEEIPEIVKKTKKKKTRPINTEVEDIIDDEDNNESMENKLSAFAMLEDADDDKIDSQSDSNESEPEVKVQVKKVETKKSKKSKKQLSKDNDDDDIDAILASIEGSNKNSPREPDITGDAEADDEAGGTIKSAAQKKKDKRERQKLEKLQKAKNKFNNKEKVKKPDETETEKNDDVKDDNVKTTIEDDNHDEQKMDEVKEGNETKKDKKKKKKKGEKVEEEKVKKPSKMVKAMQERLKAMKEEDARLKQEEEDRILKEEEDERIKLEKDAFEKEKKERIKAKKKEAIDKLKAEGKYFTAKQKDAQRRAQQMLEAMKAQGLEVPVKHEEIEHTKKRVVYSRKKKPINQRPTSTEEHIEQTKVVTPESKREKKEKTKIVKESDDDWDADSSDGEIDEIKEEVKIIEEIEEESEEEDSDTENSSEDSSSEEESSSEDEDLTAREKVEIKIAKRRADAESRRSTDILRAPVVVVLGHVDTGKTKILDKLRRTNVQDGEAGGITQQIGATNVPHDAIKEQTRMCKDFIKKELKLPGMLIIDTPGHESFSNLRSRGSSLCDIAILVVDIMHGLEPQTLESIKLLLSKKTPFIVALNKVDRLFQWQSNPHGDITNTLKKQKPNTKLEFDDRLQQTILQFAEQGLNAKLFNENKDYKEYISLVPTSAHSGDGIGNLIALICEISQDTLAQRISYSDELKATAMEVKSLPGLGTTVDVILVNGSLKEGDHIILAGTEGPITTQIRGLLMPKPMREIRVKSNYDHHKEVKAAQGVKIIAKDLEKSLAGLPILVSHSPEETEICREEIAIVLKDVLDSIRIQDRGVYVQASTLGSLEALLEFLRTSKIPCSGINIGPVHKKDIMKASVMIEHDSQFAVVLAFDVKVEREAQEMADSVGVTVFQADIIYHLFDKFMEFREKHKKEKQEQYKFVAVFPCKLRILPQCVFKSRDPIICGVIVEAGFLKVGTPVCVPNKEFLNVGRVTSLEFNKKTVDRATKGQEVCIKIEGSSGEAPKMVGRHFDETDLLYSKISRESIDAVKNYFRDDMTKTDWQLMVELKKTFDIM